MTSIGSRLNWRSPKAILVMILFLAAVLRVARLETLPPGVFRDEAEKAYNAYSILKTGRDVEGRLLPVYVHVFGVTTSAIYQYATIPFIAFFGLNEWSTRLPAATVGVLTVLTTWVLVRKMRDARTANWAALLLALSPWHIVFSRWAQQGIFLPLFLSIGAIGLVSAKDTSESRYARGWLIAGAAAFGFATYVYDVARLFVPLLLLVAWIAYSRSLLVRPIWLLIAGIACVVSAIPTFYLLVFAGEAAQARFHFVSIFQPGLSTGAVVVAFFRNYLAHWSSDFLILHGDAELRHGAGVGVLTLLELLGLIAGVYVLLRERTRENWFWLGWLLLFPVAASLTRVGIPHALRCIVALPAIQVVAAIGLGKCTQHIRIERRAAFQQSIALLAILSFLPFGLRYYSHSYAVYSAFNWQAGLKEALHFCDEPPLRDSTVYLHNIVGAEYLVPFFEKPDPHEVQSAWSSPPVRLGRFAYMPFQQLDRVLQVTSNAPVAYITVPGNYTWPADWRPIGFYPVHDERFSPILYVYLNPALRARLEK